MRKLSAIALAAVAVCLAGCSLTKIETTRKDTFRFSPEVSTMTYDASRRGVFILKRQDGKTGKRVTVICPEPPPDVAVQYAAALGASLAASGKVSGNVINPLGTVGSVTQTVSPSGIRDVVTSLVKDKKISLPSGALTEADIAKAMGEAGVSLSFAASQTQTPSQLGISDAISLLRNSQFWACINQANSGSYNAEAFDQHQLYIEEITKTLILAQYGRIINETKQSLVASGLSEKEAATQVAPLRNYLKELQQLNRPLLKFTPPDE